MESVELVVPTIPADINIFLENLNRIKEFIPISSVYIIGSKEVEHLIPDYERIFFIDELTLVNFPKIQELIIKKTGVPESGKRAGWYVQQFLKMSFAFLCDEEYYLLWDSDTIPLRHISLFNDGNPCFDCKTEYNEPYFKTIDCLFPGLRKKDNYSFISEHMLIKTEYMKQLILEIESNGNLIGDNFQEKIIDAIDASYIDKSGFSEFETYGTYVSTRFPNSYSIRKWKSMRFGGFFYNGSKSLLAEDINWLCKKYDAISFEKRDTISRISRVTCSNIYMRFFPSSSLEILAFMIRVARRIKGAR